MSFWILNGIKVYYSIIINYYEIGGGAQWRIYQQSSNQQTSSIRPLGSWVHELGKKNDSCAKLKWRSTFCRQFSQSPSSPRPIGRGARPIWRQLMFLWLNFESLDPIWFYGGQPCFMIFLGAVLMMVQLEVFHLDLQCAHRSLAAIEWALITWSVENPSLDHLDFKNEATLIDSDRF